MLEKKSSKSITQKEILNTGCKVTLMQDAKSTKKALNSKRINKDVQLQTLRESERNEMRHFFMWNVHLTDANF